MGPRPWRGILCIIIPRHILGRNGDAEARVLRQQQGGGETCHARTVEKGP